MKNTGLIIPEVQPDHFIFGAGQLQDNPVNPDGQWLSWLPVKENQSSPSNPLFDPQACVSFAITSCIEAMVARKFGRFINLSDRFLAYASGTTRQGNDPHTVAETLRKIGDVLQEDWDYPTPVDWDIYYAPPPQKLYRKAKEFNFEYAFGHSWVTDPSPERLKKALTYSPLAVAVAAWSRDENGLYFRNGDSNHDVMLAGYQEGAYWVIFDSYEQNVKKLRWDFTFEAVKRFTIDRNIRVETAWHQFLKLWRTYFSL